MINRNLSTIITNIGTIYSFFFLNLIDNYECLSVVMRWHYNNYRFIDRKTYVIIVMQMRILL